MNWTILEQLRGRLSDWAGGVGGRGVGYQVLQGHGVGGGVAGHSLLSHPLHILS